jgi:hypothetical protein
MEIHDHEKSEYGRAYERGRRHGYEAGLRQGKEDANAWPKFIENAVGGIVTGLIILAAVSFIFNLGQMNAVTELAKAKLAEREQKTASVVLPGTSLSDDEQI